jgi:small subunit ribosomal protein S16
MVRIRLRRVGAKHQPSYRIVAAEKEDPATGDFLEILGHYNPRTRPATVDLDEARFFHWMRNGAQPSDSLVKVLKTYGTWDRWDRVRAGEPVEAVVASAGSQPTADPRTRREDTGGTKPSKKAQMAAQAEEAAGATGQG